MFQRKCSPLYMEYKVIIIRTASPVYFLKLKSNCDAVDANTSSASRNTLRSISNGELLFSQE